MITKIIDNIYIGNSQDPKNKESLEEHKITAILNVAHDLNDSWYNDIISCKVGLTDGSCSTNESSLKAAIALLVALIANNHNVLIHCHRGANRAPFVVACYLGGFDNWQKEFEKIKGKRDICATKDWMAKLIKEVIDKK